MKDEKKPVILDSTVIDLEAQIERLKLDKEKLTLANKKLLEDVDMLKWELEAAPTK